MIEPKKEFMLEAIRQANKAKKAGDYAIGAVVVKNNKIIASCGTRTKTDVSPIAHAEILVLIKACQTFKSAYLPDCILYTTHELCPMCASACVWTKLKAVVYGARTEDMKTFRENNPNGNFSWRTIDIPCNEVFSKSTEKMEAIKDFMREECVKLFHQN